MKKSLQEESEGNPPAAKPSETRPNAAGKDKSSNSLVRVIIGVVITLVVLSIIYLITRQNAGTFKINNL